jgi:hypothetical protein
MKKILLAWCFVLASFSVQAATYGPVANFDVINDTGKVAHGFEIEIDGISTNNITSLFGEPTRWPGMERYGFPVVTTTPTGVRVTYQDLTKSTPSGTLPVAPSDSCWPLGAKTYGPLYPCDHFGVSTNVATPVVRYHWLVESTPGSTTLVPVDAAVPNPQVSIAPVPPVANVPQPPVAHAVFVAPPPVNLEFGPAQWVKVTAIGSPNPIAVEDLMGDNALIQGALVQTEWQRLQYDANAGAGGANGTIDFSGVALDPGAVAVAYRFEYYAYKGDFDTATGEAIGILGPDGVTIIPGSNIDTSGSKTPPVTVGKYLGAQMAGANMDGAVAPPAPKLPIAPTINASIAGGVINQQYSSSFDVTPFNAGDTVTVDITGLPAPLSFATVGSTTTISGLPAAPGHFPISIIAKDTSNNTTISANTFIDIADAPMVFNVTFPDATVNVAYSYPFIVTGGYGSLTFSTVNTLPAGLSISNGALSGKPTVAGTYPLNMTVTDSLNFSQNAALANLVVKDAAVVPPPIVPPPVACSGTNKILTSASPITLEIGGGIANPGGQTVDVPANITFVSPLTSTNAYAADNLATFTGTVNVVTKHCVADTASIAQGLTVSFPTLYNGQVGVDYSTVPAGNVAATVNATGGIAPYTISVSGLPLGMSLNASNALVGIPTVAGTYPITISVNDSNGQTINSSLSLIVDPAAAVAVSCSGTKEPITSIADAARLSNIAKYDGTILKSAYISTALNNVAVPAAVVVYTFSGGLTVGIFNVGNLITYSGTYGAAAGGPNGNPMWCIPTVVTVDPAPVAPPPASCPTTGKSSVGQFKVVSVGTTSITMSNGAVVNYLPCTVIEWNRKSHVFVVGDSVEWKGYIVNGSIIANKLTAN